MSLQKSEIELEANRKPFNAYLVSPSSSGPGLSVLPSWFGLKPYFKQVCDRLAEQGYTALGLDYYNGHIGTLGFSMGADWAVITAANEQDLVATVLFYGSYKDDFSNMKSRVLGHYAEKDEYQSPQRTSGMVENLNTADVDVKIYNYPGTAHWFMEQDRPEYNAAAVSLARERKLEFLKQSL